MSDGGTGPDDPGGKYGPTAEERLSAPIPFVPRGPKRGPGGPPGPRFDGYREKITKVAGIDLRCTAQTTKGERCRLRVVPGWEICHNHKRAFDNRGRTNLMTSGRYSRLLPPKLQERYDAAAGDPELLKIEDEIRLVDARLQTLAGALSDTATLGDEEEAAGPGPSPAMWKSVKSRLGEVLTQHRRRQYGEAVPTLMALMSDIGGQIAEAAQWDEIGRWMDRRKALVESERRRLVELQQYVPAQRVQVMLTAIGSVIQTHVSDPALLAAIATGIGRVVAAGPRSTAPDSSRAEITLREGPDDREPA